MYNFESMLWRAARGSWFEAEKLKHENYEYVLLWSFLAAKMA